MPQLQPTTSLVTGASGFIGKALVDKLAGLGHHVIATSRRTRSEPDPRPSVEWRYCDLLAPESLPPAVKGATTAYYLVHSMGGGNTNYIDSEQQSARNFATAAAEAGVERIVYLGGPAPPGVPSKHLKSRLQVGEILRAGSVPTVELRASMVVGRGSASWQIVCDLAKRLPFMILPKWLRSRTRPVALEDVIAALIGAAHLPIDKSTWFDIPGPDIVSGREVLERIAKICKRKILIVEVPLLTPSLSALWLRLVTQTDFQLARELVMGLREDLLPDNEDFWGLIGHTSLLSFDQAARRALETETSIDAIRSANAHPS